MPKPDSQTTGRRFRKGQRVIVKLDEADARDLTGGHSTRIRIEQVQPSSGCVFYDLDIECKEPGWCEVCNGR